MPTGACNPAFRPIRVFRTNRSPARLWIATRRRAASTVRQTAGSACRPGTRSPDRQSHLHPRPAHRPRPSVSLPGTGCKAAIAAAGSSPLSQTTRRARPRARSRPGTGASSGSDGAPNATSRLFWARPTQGRRTTGRGAARRRPGTRKRSRGSLPFTISGRPLVPMKHRARDLKAHVVNDRPHGLIGP